MRSEALDRAAARGAAAPARGEGWLPWASVSAVMAAGMALFISSLPGVNPDRVNGLGLLSALPPGVIAGVLLLATGFVLTLGLPRAYPAPLAAGLAGLVVCLDGITAFVEPEPRFPTAYQIAGYVHYVSATGHTAPGLAAYFNWPGFFALVSLVAGAAGTHGLLTLMRVWPMLIDLLCLPPLFLFTRNLRVSWRARWLAGFLFVVGNWVGQDYFSPQSLGFLLYLVFIAILVNWFARPDPAGGRGLRVFLLAVLVAIFTVVTVSHQLTPFFMIAACAGLVLARRCTLTSLPVLLAVILLGWVSFEAVGYWSGHLTDIFGGLGDLGFNVTSSVSGRLAGSTPTHLLALHARVGMAAVLVALAVLGLLRRRRHGASDRVLAALLCVPVLMVGLQSYGGEIILRVYLFLLPAACVLAAGLFFPGAGPRPPRWRSLSILVACAVLLPAGFGLARYGNEIFEQTPAGELAATNWVYAHDGAGARLLWLSTDPQTDVTPEMPWSYRDLAKVVYVPALAPRDPARVTGLISTLRAAGPGSYLIATRTQVAAMQQTASYAPGWGRRFIAAMAAAPGARVAFATAGAIVYAVNWPPGARGRPLGLSLGAPVQRDSDWNVPELIAFWLLLAVLMLHEFGRVGWAAARTARVLMWSAAPLLVLFLGVVAVRFVMLS